MKLIKSASWYNPYLIENAVTIQNIFIFKDGEIVFKTGKGWFNSGNNNIPVVDFPQHPNKRKNKQDLTVNFPYYIKDILYIPAELVNFKDLGESLKRENTYQREYFNTCELTLNAKTISLETYTRTEYTEEGKRALKIATILEEETGKSFGIYTIEGILKKLDIKIK